MAAAKPCANSPVFKIRAAADGVAAAYLAWRISGRVKISPSGCWECVSSGYGLIDLSNWEWPQTTVLLHRVIYQLCVGPIPKGMWVLHRCDNPSCCRPDHLFLGTNKDNIDDMVAKGRQAKGQSVRRNHEHLKGERVNWARFTAEQVMEIRRRYRDGESGESLGREFKTSGVNVMDMVRGKTWSHLPIYWDGKNQQDRECPKCNKKVSVRGGHYYKHVKNCLDS